MPAVVLITGATGGLGKALAAACAARGWRLWLTDLSAQSLSALATGLKREFDVDVAWYACDLTSPGDRASLWSHFSQHGLRVWMLLNVAGLDHQGLFVERRLDDLLTVARLNVEAVIEMCHHAFSMRSPDRTLCLVNITSFAAFHPMPGKAVYAASKRFMLDVSRALHVELRSHNATVTAVCPAGMATAPRAVGGIEALGFWGRLTASPVNLVARRTLDAALRGRALYVPGLGNRLILAASALIPLQWRLRWIADRWSQRLASPPLSRPEQRSEAPALLNRSVATKRDLCDRHIVITGATSGIGRATLELLAARGAHVIGIGRSPERCKETKKAVLDRWPIAYVDLVVADLSSQRQVRRAAAQVRDLLTFTGRQLDALINNAGTVSTHFISTEDGYELQFAVNHLAAFLLTHELLPLLRRSPAGRVITVSSRSHRFGRIHWDDPMLRHNYRILCAYQQTKVANVLFTAELNRRLAPSGTVQAFVADPGLVDTNIGSKKTSGLSRFVWRLRRRGGRHPQVPARNIVYLATDPTASLKRGLYWKDCQPLRPSAYALNEEHGARLWELSARLCGLSDSACGEQLGDEPTTHSGV